NTASPNSCEYEPIVDMADLDKRFGPLPSAKEGRSPSHSHHSGDSRRASGRAYRGRFQDDESVDGQQAAGRSNKGKLKDEESGDSPQTPGRTYKGRHKDEESGETPYGSSRAYKGRVMDDESGDTPNTSGRAYKGRLKDDESGDTPNASGRAYMGRLKDDDGPPPDPSFNPLADRSRTDQKEGFSDHKRHPRNYGGSADLTRVKQSMRHMKEK
ncbi:unnamed protein product, partial [Candidula unifasciata]